MAEVIASASSLVEEMLPVPTTTEVGDVEPSTIVVEVALLNLISRTSVKAAAFSVARCEMLMLFVLATPFPVTSRTCKADVPAFATPSLVIVILMSPPAIPVVVAATPELVPPV